MLYIERDEHGAIIGIHNSATTQAQEIKNILDPEVIEFLNSAGLPQGIGPLLNLFDNSIIRVLDDLIDLLVAKNIIMLTELPEEAQKKIKLRKMLRQKLHAERFIVENIL